MERDRESGEDDINKTKFSNKKNESHYIIERLFRETEVRTGNNYDYIGSMIPN